MKTSQIKFKIGVSLYTYDRTDDARINQEIIRELWGGSDHFNQITIVHAYNGDADWYPEKYLEDALIRLTNPGHFQGAAELMDAGMQIFQQKYPDIDYIVVLAADSWLSDPAYLANLLTAMHDQHKLLATCPWGIQGRDTIPDVGLAVDFFVLDAPFAFTYHVFPLDFAGFSSQYNTLLLYLGHQAHVEKLLSARMLEAIFRQNKNNNLLRRHFMESWLRLTDREPVHTHIDDLRDWQRREYWPEMGLITYHDPTPKQAVLRQLKLSAGPELKRLIESSDLSYYNQH